MVCLGVIEEPTDEAFSQGSRTFARARAHGNFEGQYKVLESSIIIIFFFLWMSLVTDLFFPVLILNQLCSPPLRLQASHCRTFRIMCDVPNFVVNLLSVFLVQVQIFP